MVAVAFIQGHDTINYRLMERQGGRAVRKSNPPYPRSCVCIIHEGTKISRGLNWGKKQNIQAEKVFVLTPIKVFFLLDLLKSSNTYWISR